MTLSPPPQKKLHPFLSLSPLSDIHTIQSTLHHKTVRFHKYASLLEKENIGSLNLSYSL